MSHIDVLVCDGDQQHETGPSFSKYWRFKLFISANYYYYKYDLRKGELFVLSWARVRRGAANVWWRCAQYFVIASCG